MRKQCPDCNKIQDAAPFLNFCMYCSCDLRNEPEIPFSQEVSTKASGEQCVLFDIVDYRTSNINQYDVYNGRRR